MTQPRLRWSETELARLDRQVQLDSGAVRRALFDRARRGDTEAARILLDRYKVRLIQHRNEGRN